VSVDLVVGAIILVSRDTVVCHSFVLDWYVADFLSHFLDHLFVNFDVHYKN